MNLIPTPIQHHLNRVDRTRSLWLAIGAGLTALWTGYRVFWLLYSATVVSGVGISAATLIISAVIWGVVGLAAALVSVAFFLRYTRES